MSDKEKPCPNCGHCPTCGKSKPVQWWPYPVYPVYPLPTTTCPRWNAANPIQYSYTFSSNSAAN